MSRPLAVGLLLLAVACSGTTTPAAPPVPASTSTSNGATSNGATSTTATTSAAPGWQGRAPAPTARQEVASAVVDGRVWVIGGLTAAGASAAVESYDPGTDRWAPGPPLPVALHHAAATAYRGEVVVMGGFLAAGSLYDRPSDRVLALRAGAWVDLPRLGRPRGAGGASVVGAAAAALAPPRACRRTGRHPDSGPGRGHVVRRGPLGTGRGPDFPRLTVPLS